MCHAHNEKWKKTNNRKNRIAKSRKHQKSRKKRKSGDERKTKTKEHLRQMKKNSRNQTLQQKSHQRNKHLDCSPCKILRTILKMDKERNQTNGLNDAQGLTSEK